jgi:serine protease Do
MPLFPPIPMKAKTFVLVFGGLELLLRLILGSHRRGALRAPGRHAGRLVDDPLLARAAALRPKALTARSRMTLCAGASLPSARASCAWQRLSWTLSGLPWPLAVALALATAAPLANARPPRRAGEPLRSAVARARARCQCGGGRAGGWPSADAARPRHAGPRPPGLGRRDRTDGLVLTIGYLILEADQVLLITDDGAHPRPGGGLRPGHRLRPGAALAPLQLAPAPLGRLGRRGDDDTLMVVSGGDRGHQRGALVSRGPSRRLLGVPRRRRAVHRAAAARPQRRRAVQRPGELVGIGSLIVNDAAGGTAGCPATCSCRRPAVAHPAGVAGAGPLEASGRAWMGVNCVEQATAACAWCASPRTARPMSPVLEVGDQILSPSTAGRDHARITVEALWRAQPRARRRCRSSAAARSAPDGAHHRPRSHAAPRRGRVELRSAAQQPFVHRRVAQAQRKLLLQPRLSSRRDSLMKLSCIGDSRCASPRRG